MGGWGQQRFLEGVGFAYINLYFAELREAEIKKMFIVSPQGYFCLTNIFEILFKTACKIMLQPKLEMWT